MKNPRDIIIRPVVSEKSYAAYDENVYTFIVANDANKIEIRNAVQELFGKKVSKVHTINRKGKRKRNRRTGTWGARATQKRAIVTLAAGGVAQRRERLAIDRVRHVLSLRACTLRSASTSRSTRIGLVM